MTVAEAAARFTADSGLQGTAALAEARRAAWDPTYGRYTWGKLEVLALRERALARPGATLAGFHRDLLALGAPPLGLLGAVLQAAVDRGELAALPDVAEVGARLLGPLFFRYQFTALALTGAYAEAVADEVTDRLLGPGR